MTPTTENAKGHLVTSIILLVVLTLVWGTSFILMKKGLTVFSAGEVGAIRVISASIFLAPLALLKLKELSARDYGKLFFSGLMGIFFPAFLFATAQTRLESSVTGILNSLTPMFTLLIGVIVFGQQFKIRSVIGILIGLAGTVLLILSRSSGTVTGVNGYVIFVFIACICYGINVNFVKQKFAGLSAVTITSVALLLIGPFAIVYLFGLTDFVHKFEENNYAWTALFFLVLLGVMSTSIATILFNRLIKIRTALFASSITYLIPIVAVIWGLIDGEKLTSGHYLGMIAIIAGVYMANRK